MALRVYVQGMWLRKRPEDVDHSWYPQDGRRVVQVRFCDDGPSGRTWGYLWGLRRPPRLGDWVIVPAGDGVKVGLVEDFGAEGYEGDVKKVHRFATLTEAREAVRDE